MVSSSYSMKQSESVQKKFTKRLPRYASLCYKDRLRCHGLESLEMRHLRLDLLYTYKIVFGPVNQAACNIFALTNSFYSTRTRGHANKLHLRNSRLDVDKYFFSLQIIQPTIYLQRANICIACHHLNVLLIPLTYQHMYLQDFKLFVSVNSMIQP